MNDERVPCPGPDARFGGASCRYVTRRTGATTVRGALYRCGAGHLFFVGADGARELVETADADPKRRMRNPAPPSLFDRED